MSEVPEDLMKVAREVVVGISNDIEGGWIDEAAAKVAVALSAERERATLAERERWQIPPAANAEPDRFVITGIVKEGKHEGESVWVGWTPEGGGWWQWGPEAWAERFPSETDPRFEDAMRSARGETWTTKSCGPWYYYPDMSTVKSVRVPAIVSVCVR